MACPARARNHCLGPENGPGTQTAGPSASPTVPCRVPAVSAPLGYLDVQGGVRFTSLSRRTLDYAKARGDLPFVRKGRKILFKVEDLARWMDADRIDVTGDLTRMEETGAIPAAGQTRGSTRG